MEISLVHVKRHSQQGVEPLTYSATLLLDGQPIGTIENQSGPTRLRPLASDVQAMIEFDDTTREIASYYRGEGTVLQDACAALAQQALAQPPTTDAAREKAR